MSRIQLRRDTAANWTSANPILAIGEPGVETDTGKEKLGDGASTWTNLPYNSDPAGTAATLVATETTRAETAEALLAPKASPALTGTPTAPTQTALDASTKVATTAYADGAVAVEKIRAEGVEATKASLASPALTGTPTAPTQTGGDNTTKLATTAFVTAALAADSGAQIAAGNLGATASVTLTAALVQVTGTLTANCALTLTGLVAGSSIALLLAQDATGGRTFTVNGFAVTVPSAASAAFTVQVYSPDGTTLYILPPGFGSADAQTLANKRITRRVVTVAQSATPAINTDILDVASLTGLAQAVTSMTSSLTGTPNDGDLLLVRLTDNGTARAITWGGSFEASGNVVLPPTTSASVMLMVGFAWNAATSKWRCIAVA